MISVASFNSNIGGEDFGGEDYVQDALRRREIACRQCSYQDFINQLYKDIDSIICQMQRNPELRQGDSEDRLSGDIISMLGRHGYKSSPDTKAGGHIDISVELGGFTWIGEAKKDGAFDEGFLQLTTRYVPASGDFSHDQRGLLFYFVKTKNAYGVLTNWREQISKGGIICEDCKKNEKLAFYILHKDEGLGLDVKIRVMAVVLYHNPQDRSGRARKKQD